MTVYDWIAQDLQREFERLAAPCKMEIHKLPEKNKYLIVTEGNNGEKNTQKIHGIGLLLFVLGEVILQLSIVDEINKELGE